MKNISFVLLGLKRRILISFSLITLIPLAVFLNYFYGLHLETSLPVKLILVLIVFLGWVIIFEIFSSVVKINTNTCKTLKSIGEEPPAITDEIQSLDLLIGVLSSKVKDGFSQLKDLSQKTEDLSKEVSKKVLVLSAILQANDLVSKGVPAEEAIQLLMQRLQQILAVKICCCSVKINTQEELKPLVCFGASIPTMEAMLKQENEYLLSLRDIVIFDKGRSSAFYLKWSSELEVNSILIMPLLSKGQHLGVIFIAGTDDVIDVGVDDRNILNLFSQNASLIWQHKKLLGKVEELEILDYLTGLYNEKYMMKRFDEEIKRAITCQRPCGFLFLEIEHYDTYSKEYGIIEGEKLLKRIAKVFTEVLRPIDIAGRLGTNRLAAILIERNKRQSEEVEVNLKQKLEPLFKEKISIKSSVAESPVDGITACEIMSFAQVTH